MSLLRRLSRLSGPNPVAYVKLTQDDAEAVERLVEDARRYRHIRDHADPGEIPGGVVWQFHITQKINGDTLNLPHEFLDLAIDDAAMAATREG